MKGDRLRRASAATALAIRGGWTALRRPRAREPLWAAALACGRASSTALALVLFVAAFTLDDLHLLRVPALYVGLALAVVAYAAGPPLLAARLLDRLAADAHPDPGHAVQGALVRRRVSLALTVALLVGWLVLFSSGATPRW